MALNPVVDIFKYISSVAALQLRSRPGSEPAAPEERLRHQAAALASLASAVLQRLQELLQGVDVASISSVSAVQQGPVEEDGTRYLIGEGLLAAGGTTCVLCCLHDTDDLFCGGSPAWLSDSHAGCLMDGTGWPQAA